MRKLVRLGLAIALVVPALTLVAASQGSASPLNSGVAITCNANPDGPGTLTGPTGPIATMPTVPSVALPPAVPVLGGTEILGSTQACADLNRTLVFVGTAEVN